MNYSEKPGFLILLILLTSAMGYLSLDLYLPSLPAMSQHFSITPSQSQLTLTVFLITFCFSQLFYGPLSDRYGRRPMLLVGFSIYILATCACLFANNIQQLLIARLFQGLGIGAGAVLSRSMLRDQFSGNELGKMAAFLNMGVCIATTVSPALGGLLQQAFNYKANFAALLIIACLTFFLLCAAPETNKNTVKHTALLKQTLRDYTNVIRHRIFILNVLCAGLGLSALIIYSVANPFLFQTQLGLSARTYGLFALAIAACEVIGSFISGHVVTKIGVHKMLAAGFILMLLMSTLIFIFGKYGQINLLSVLLPTMGIGISVGIILPNASAGAFSVFDSGIGVVGAMYGFLQLLITTGASFVISALGIHNQSGIGCMIMIASLFGLLSCYFISSPKKSHAIS